MLNFRTCVACILGPVALVAMVWGYASNRSLVHPVSTPFAASDQSNHGREGTVDLPDGHAGWIRMEAPTRDQHLKWISTSASQRFVASGMSEMKATKLADDLLIILTSMIKPDFDAYDRLMTSKGAHLDKLAEGFTSAMLEWKIYPAETHALFAEKNISQRIRYIWNHPAERDVEWTALRPESLTIGFGLIAESNTPEWPYSGHYAQFSVYAPQSGRLKEKEGKILNQSKDSAWVMLEGRFTSGMQTRMKINFYYDEAAGTWIPIAVVFGTDQGHRPFPML